MYDMYEKDNKKINKNNTIIDLVLNETVEKKTDIRLGDTLLNEIISEYSSGDKIVSTAANETKKENADEKDDYAIEAIGTLDIVEKKELNIHENSEPFFVNINYFSDGEEDDNDGFSKRKQKPAVKSKSYTIAKDFFEWAESVFVSVISIVIAMTFLFRMNEVYGASMQPTLHEGDRLIVLPLTEKPKYGDVVIIEAVNMPNSLTGELGEAIVKRVIGIEGDEIFIDPVNGEVYRNGERLEEKYIAEKIRAENLGNQSYPLTIKENEVFVLGDNRNHSTDSRYAEGYIYYVGCVNLDYVLGKAVFRIWPPESIGGIN